MRLINCKTLKLEFKELQDAPPYAILSHTWGDGEVTFADFHQTGREKLDGWEKIALTCQQALQDGLEYVWVDTCCIDKSSSAELSESINSMFKWYAHSHKCYAFLTDYSCSESTDEDFAKCNWFSRGWTLQELIAPSTVMFFDKHWQYIGTKKDLSIQISQNTNINGDILTTIGFDAISTRLYACSVAQRMSWAATRKTKREEDIAYCLLGIFGISMPMLYGEGDRAFMRLQEEIIKETNDMTLFAWQTSDHDPVRSFDEMHLGAKTYRGILAKSPREFSVAHQLRPFADLSLAPEYRMTNKGLKLSSEVVLKALNHDTYFMPLNCYTLNLAFRHCGICLKNYGAGVFARVYPDRLLLEPQSAQTTPGKIYISKTLLPAELQALKQLSRQAFRLSYKFSTSKYVCTVEAIEPRNQWVPAKGFFMLSPGQSSFTGYHRILWQRKDSNNVKNRKSITSGRFMALCGWNKGSEPWFCLASAEEDPELYKAAETMALGLAGELGKLSKRIRTPLRFQFPPNAGITLKTEEEVGQGTTLSVFDVQVWLGVDNFFPHNWQNYGYDEALVHYL
ncbi:unnamed protein product [Clonostachys rhizophaga]|uniref:Heterokaryon incompatibility domain-containing protein n=1 Tax=Clonostachys rhizophaga TaxID=160324 RepID=A0A9N9VG55_9HYPO|nr:unnamed protein product [Clonostachys rhizophaga]